jgi:hypothetical protein
LATKTSEVGLEDVFKFFCELFEVGMLLRCWPRLLQEEQLLGTVQAILQ